MYKNSLLYWYPKVRGLVPTPRTEIVNLDNCEKNAYLKCIDSFLSPSLCKKIIHLTEGKFELPIFLRTDLSSNKHSWEKSCFIDDMGKLPQNLNELISESKLANFLNPLPIEAIIVREYIEMDSKFRAFPGNMPVNPERRYFINNKSIQCHHPYWIEDSIRKGASPLPENWRELLEIMNTENEEEITLLSGWAKKIAEVFPEYWSVDFCRAKTGEWYMIDMAKGEESWHPYYCRYSNEEPPKKEEKSDFSFMVRKK